MTLHNAAKLVILSTINGAMQTPWSIHLHVFMVPYGFWFFGLYKGLQMISFVSSEQSL